MHKKTVLLVAALSICGALSALEWPLPEATLVRNFGYNDQGKPVLGMVFEGEGDVQASDAGKVIFSSSGMDKASRLPSPLGAWTAVDHGEGLITIYGRYGDEGRKNSLEDVNQGAAIATAGRSGWSNRNGVYFQLYDRRGKHWANASMVINPLPDDALPQILGIQLRASGGNPINVSQSQRISQGNYAIEVNAIDRLVANGAPLAPHRITTFVNGKEIRSLAFEVRSSRDGALTVIGDELVSARQVYAPFPAFEVGSTHFSRGQAILEIIVQDIVGNSRSTVTRVAVE
jgi:murein DD-endopeptidase MepM/ murein hydrolase activator NlpD